MQNLKVQSTSTMLLVIVVVVVTGINVTLNAFIIFIYHDLILLNNMYVPLVLVVAPPVPSLLPLPSTTVFGVAPQAVRAR